MTTEQILAASLVAAVLALFVWDKLRHDVVALTALLAGLALGVIPAATAFEGYSNPAVITVAAVLAISHALESTGAVALVARAAGFNPGSVPRQVAGLCLIGAALSAFMNNVGALALTMPLAMAVAARRDTHPGQLLMPLSFATLLGGMVTLIGTPPNILISSYRAEIGLGPFDMFDFAPVGLAVAGVGLAYLVLVGWRLAPLRDRPGGRSARSGVDAFLSEYVVGAGSPLVGRSLGDAVAQLRGAQIEALGLVREGRWIPAYWSTSGVLVGDRLLAEGAPEALAALDGRLGLSLSGRKSEPREDGKARPGFGERALAEIVLKPSSPILGATAEELKLRARYSVNLLAVSRRNSRHFGALRSLRFDAGDVLLLQGSEQHIDAATAAFHGLTLADRGIGIPRPRAGLVALAIFIAAIIAMATTELTAPVAMLGAVVAMTLTGALRPRSLYQGVDWTVIVLLGALIPVGGALETSGVTRLLADAVVWATLGGAPWAALAAILVATQLVTAMLNNAATVVIMAPVGVGVARALGVSPDPFLMAVAIGASCDFLLPIGHQCNILVMGPGGYRFSDYWRVGLALEILVVLVAVPALLTFWPL